MNDKTIKFLQELADKFGTTTERLWGALLHQAPISATCDLIWFPVSAACLIIGMKMAVKGYYAEEKHSETYGIPVCIGGVLITLIGMVMLFASICNTEMIIAGFFNPEYWALKQIIK